MIAAPSNHVEVVISPAKSLSQDKIYAPFRAEGDARHAP